MKYLVFTGIILGLLLIGVPIYHLLYYLLNRPSRKNTDHSSDYLIGPLGPDQYKIPTKLGYFVVEDDGKRIFGHPPKTKDEWDRWWVNKGLAEGYYRHLEELEKRIDSVKEDTPASVLTEWFDYYQKYRDHCYEFGIWNQIVNDRKAFIASPSQREAECRAKEQIRRRYETAEIQRVARRTQEETEVIFQNAMLDYIARQPGHTVQRSHMLKVVSKQQNIPRDALLKIYGKMVTKHILSEKKVDGRYFVKKARKRAEKKEEPVLLPKSRYYPSNYSEVSKRTYYKALDTVNPPINIDYNDSKCEFVSMSSGQTYYTSLEKCTCPAYQDASHPCKHMLAFAIKLGYFNPQDVK